MISRYIQVPITTFIVTNKNTGKTYDIGLDFEKADIFLNEMREERQEAEWELTAIIDA